MTPIAHSSAIIPAIVSAGVAEGMHTMSSPTEHTDVSASSFSSPMAPTRIASAMPASSLTGMNAPLRPPTREDAIAPPFLTASVSIASAAVVPGAPHRSIPIASMICATESPFWGVGANERSTIPKSTFIRAAISLPTNSPTRVILNAARLTTSASSPRSQSPIRSTKALMTPGPDIPTFTTDSGSPGP